MTNQADAAAFASYLQSIVRIDALDRMTQGLQNELTDSQKIMSDIKTMFESIPTSQTTRQETANNGLRHEDLSKFLEAGVPKLLLPDMTESSVEDVDLDQVLSSMKTYAEELKKNITGAPPQFNYVQKDMGGLDLEHYAASLDQLSKRLTNIKLSKQLPDTRSPELEAKLSQLCQDVNMFTQVVKAKTALGNANENWQMTEVNSNALQYDELVTKLLSRINEVTYLLQNNK